MTISFKARVLLELGAELISSDAIALYELIKNGIDAGSRKKIEIYVQIAMQPSAAREIRDLYSALESADWDYQIFRDDVEQRLETTADDELKQAFMKTVGLPTSAQDALGLLDKALFDFNIVTVADQGSGMSISDLHSRYLTVATPVRLHERNNNRSKKPPLGEKGIGRFAAMRIGRHVQVETGVLNKKTWNVLEMDWRPVYSDPDLDASDLSFVPKATRKKKDIKTTGTRIEIRDLQSDWSTEKIRTLSETDFSKLVDPFLDNFANQFLRIYYQGTRQKYITGFQESLLKHADAVCEIEFRSGKVGSKKSGGEPVLQVSTHYNYYGRTEVVTHDGAHLKSCIGQHSRMARRRRASEPTPEPSDVTSALFTLGDFSAKFYWFNRGRLQKENSDLWHNKLEPFVRNWSGGFLVYRDGFRVYPYGSASDDWLDLDRKALASSAYKLNRAQIVGYLRIGIASNPFLQDQTNREGFRDCPEREALRGLLRQAVISDCKSFLEHVAREHKRASDDTIQDIDTRITENRRSADQRIKELCHRVPEESEVLESLLHELREVEEAWKKAKETLAAHTDEMEKYLHLAGIGLMTEVIAHELARATGVALDMLDEKDTVDLPTQLDALSAQLKTLNKRIRVLDELSIPGRQRKSVQSIEAIVQQAIGIYQSKAERHGITFNVSKTSQTLRRKVEKGQIIQILGNLLSNSMYWLIHRVDREAPPWIHVHIDGSSGTVSVTDNGPGISISVGDKVFREYYTTKPTGEGRGLGLSIAKRLAIENGASLRLLSPENKLHHGFALVFEDA